MLAADVVVADVATVVRGLVQPAAEVAATLEIAAVAPVAAAAIATIAAPAANMRPTVDLGFWRPSIGWLAK